MIIILIGFCENSNQKNIKMFWHCNYWISQDQRRRRSNSILKPLQWIIVKTKFAIYVFILKHGEDKLFKCPLMQMMIYGIFCNLSAFLELSFLTQTYCILFLLCFFALHLRSKPISPFSKVSTILRSCCFGFCRQN